MVQNSCVKLPKRENRGGCAIKSTIKYSNQGCTKRAKNPENIAENQLNRNYYADKPNKKWLTDVTEFKWYEGVRVHNVYLSAILDLYDRRILAYVVSERNDNPLAFKTFDRAVKPIQAHTPCSTVTEDFSIPTAPSTTRLKGLSLSP